MPWRLSPGIPQTPNVYYYKVIEWPDQRNEVGHITVVRYAEASETESAYEAIRKEAEPGKSVQPLSFGERRSQSGPSQDWNASDVLFQRCNTIVHVSLQGDELDMLQSYSQHLHERIASIVCE